MKLNSNAGRFLIAVSLLGLIVIFYPKTPDVRLTLCQDLTHLLSLNKFKKVRWKAHQIIEKGYEDLEVRLQYTITDLSEKSREVQASCFYPYEQLEIEAETFQQTSAAYATYPSRMLIAGQAVDKNSLHKGIKQLSKQHGQALLEKLNLQ